jgi:phosphatidate phosphatase APP1
LELRSLQKTFTGNARTLKDRGLSIISDIDYTIKESNVLDKKELLLNTFKRPFVAVKHMSQLFQSWKAK